MNTPCVDHGQKGNGHGYGTTYMLTETGRKRLLFHRVIFEVVHGWRPPVVLHRCDNTRCINPAHLDAGFQADNNADRATKGRSAKNVHARRVLADDEVRTIRGRYAYSPPGYASRMNPNNPTILSREFGVSHRTIMNIVNGIIYRDVV